MSEGKNIKMKKHIKKGRRKKATVRGAKSIKGGIR